MAVNDSLDSPFRFEPDWIEAPDWAQWATIDSDGNCYWHEMEPETNVIGIPNSFKDNLTMTFWMSSGRKSRMIPGYLKHAHIDDFFYNHYPMHRTQRIVWAPGISGHLMAYLEKPMTV